MAINSEFLVYSVELIASVPGLEMDPNDVVDLRERFVSVCQCLLAQPGEKHKDFSRDAWRMLLLCKRCAQTGAREKSAMIRVGRAYD